MESTALRTPRPLMIKGVYVQLCHDLDVTSTTEICVSYSRPKHLELKHGNAIAISYTWGDFNRQNQAIGHRKPEMQDDDTQPNLISVHMELGQEWDVPEFVVALQELCIDSGSIPLWIDQLCIAQQDQQEVCLALAQIPDEVALIPGGLCECILEIMAMLKASDDPIKEVIGSVEQIDQTYRGLSCFNNLAFDPWFTRMWTRQEFLYARHIRLKWTSGDSFPCPRTASIVFDGHNFKDFLPSAEQILDMVPDARLLRERFMEEEGIKGEIQTGPDSRHIQVQRRMIGASLNSWSEALQSFMEYAGIHSTKKGCKEHDAMLMLLQFLCGEGTKSGSKGLPERSSTCSSLHTHAVQFK